MLLHCTCLPTNSRGPACFTSTLKGTCCLPTSCFFFTASCSWPTAKCPSRGQAPCSCWTMHRLHWGSGHSGQHAGCSHLLHEYLLNASLITAIIHLVQNIFNNDPSHRTISLNDTYIILFKNPRNKSQCTTGTSNCTPAATWSWHHLQGCQGHACPQLHGHWLKQGTSDGWRAGHFTCTTTPCFPMVTFLRHLPTVPPQRIEQILGPGWDNGAFIHQRACLPWQQGSATITTATYMLMTRTLAAGLTTTARHSSRMQPCSIAIPWLPAPRSDTGSVHAAWSLATYAGTCTPYASWPSRSPGWSGSWYLALTKTWFRPLRVCHQHPDGTAAPSPLAKHTYALRALRFRMASQHGKKALLIDGSFSGLLANTIAHSSSSKGPPFDHKHCGYPIHEPEALWKPPAAHPEVGSGEAGHNAWPAGQLSCQCGCICNAGVGVWMWGCGVWGMWGVSGHAVRSLAWAWYLFQFPIASNPPTDSARLQQQQQQESAEWLCSLWAPEASPTWHVHNGPQGSREKVADHQALEHFLTL